MDDTQGAGGADRAGASDVADERPDRLPYWFLLGSADWSTVAPDEEDRVRADVRGVFREREGRFNALCSADQLGLAVVWASRRFLLARGVRFPRVEDHRAASMLAHVLVMSIYTEDARRIGLLAPAVLWDSLDLCEPAEREEYLWRRIVAGADSMGRFFDWVADAHALMSAADTARGIQLTQAWRIGALRIEQPNVDRLRREMNAKARREVAKTQAGQREIRRHEEAVGDDPTRAALAGKAPLLHRQVVVGDEDLLRAIHAVENAPVLLARARAVEIRPDGSGGFFEHREGGARKLRDLLMRADQGLMDPPNVGGATAPGSEEEGETLLDWGLATDALGLDERVDLMEWGPEVLTHFDERRVEVGATPGSTPEQIAACDRDVLLAWAAGERVAEIANRMGLRVRALQRAVKAVLADVRARFADGGPGEEEK